jgi:hypothetical protein
MNQFMSRVRMYLVTYRQGRIQMGVGLPKRCQELIYDEEFDRCVSEYRRKRIEEAREQYNKGLNADEEQSGPTA